MKLEQKIRNAIPELMELGVGCEVKYDNEYFTIDNNSITLDEVKNIDTPYVGYGVIGFDEYEIIGKPIQLNHVLEYLGLFDVEIRFTTDRTMLAFCNDSGKVEYWDLSNNLLSDQSQELKNFINELA